MLKSSQLYSTFQDIDIETLNSHKIVLFGASSGVTLFLERYPKIQVNYLVDNDVNKWGRKVENLEVKNPDILSGCKEKTIVLITSMYFEAIGEQLEEYGFIEGFNYFNAFSGTLPRMTCTIDASRFQEIFQEMKNQNINYVILRGFQELPEWKSKDIDILIEESDIEKLSLIKGISNSPHGIIGEIYVDGDNGKFLPYFPRELSKIVLKDSVTVEGCFKIPNELSYFYSYLYHIIYRKSKEYIVYNNENWLLKSDNKYYEELKRIMISLNMNFTNNAEELRVILKEKNYTPPLDLLRKMNLSVDNPFLSYLTRQEEAYYSKKYSQYKGLEIMFFVYRGFEISESDMGKVSKILKQKFIMISEGMLTSIEHKRFLHNVRGGNWGDDAQYEQGGLPLGYFVCIDERPQIPKKEYLDKNPYLSNINYFIKHTVRESLGNRVKNILHSSDDSYEALEYIENLEEKRRREIYTSFDNYVGGSDFK